VDEGGRARERGEAVREVEHFLSRQSDAGHPTRDANELRRAHDGHEGVRGGEARVRVDAHRERCAVPTNGRPTTRSDDEGRPRSRDASVDSFGTTTRAQTKTRGFGQGEIYSGELKNL